MQKRWLVAFLIDLYLVQIFIYVTFTYLHNHDLFPITACALIIFFVLSLILIGINLVQAIKMQKDDKGIGQEKVFKLMIGFKFGCIPFFVIHFFLWLLFFVGTLNPFLLFLWVLIPLGIFYAYITLLCTSAYSISKILWLTRKGRLTKKRCIIHIILQLIFIIDVFDSIYLGAIERKL